MTLLIVLRSYGYFAGIIEAFQNMNERIKECELRGHVQPDANENRCNYCFQHLKYETPKIDALLAERAKLPLEQWPYDASLISEMARKEIESQKNLDFFNGVEKLIALDKSAGLI